MPRRKIRSRHASAPPVPSNVPYKSGYQSVKGYFLQLSWNSTEGGFHGTQDKSLRNQSSLSNIRRKAVQSL